MSKNIVINEGGIGKQLTVDKLRTNLVGGGTCLWVPEDGTSLGTKYITENGTYRASNDGYYGYSEVTVSGIGSVTGKDPDTGEDVTVTKDPDTGEIVETVVAAEIRVTTAPTKTTYTNGENIDFSGIVVHAYSSTGRDIGEIPFNELVFPVTKADASAQGDDWTDGHGVNATLISYTPAPAIGGMAYVSRPLGNVGGKNTAYGSVSTPGQYLMTRYNNANYGCKKTGDGSADYFRKTDVEGVGEIWSLNGSSTASMTNNSFRPLGFGDVIYDLPSSTVDPATVDPTSLHAMQSVPVQWTQSGSSTALEASFSINVTT